MYTVTPVQGGGCCPGLYSARGLVTAALLLAAVQLLVTGADLGLAPPSPHQGSCVPGHQGWQWSLASVSWLLLLALASTTTALLCLKYDVTNRDAQWALVCLISLTTIWVNKIHRPFVFTTLPLCQVSWLVTRTLLEARFQEPVVVMALVVSALLAALCLYARKLYEFTEFGRADTKLELMSNIMLRSVHYSTVQYRSVQ